MRKTLALLLVLSLVLPLVCFGSKSVAFAQAAESFHDKDHDLPGGTLWETKDFRAWLTKQPQNLQYRVQNIIGSNKESEVIVVVLSPDRYREWLELYTNESTRTMVAESSIVVPRSFLPIEVTRHLSASEVQYGYTSSDEAVIVTLSGDEWVKCPYCQILVSALIGWALGRFVFDPLWNAMEAEWREHFTSKDCPHKCSTTSPASTMFPSSWYSVKEKGPYR